MDIINIDYKKLGLKCGIEIHQQLDTKKLFCSCPSQIREDEPDVRVKRKMRVVAGELGDIDPAALYEFLKDREIIYEAYFDSNCLVELDEEPPHVLNEEALSIALEISLLLNATIIPELQIMRKTVIDGSNPSGFQRTVLIAVDGSLETSEGRVEIPTICLEEDAARKIREEGKGGNKVFYRVDRLGIPLIEIATSANIKTPKHAREVAEKLGMILRATGKVKRGLGTIRQDLNISISEGERIEVKGVQDLRLISKVVELEIKRQLMLIEVKKELQGRGIKEGDLRYDFYDVTEVFKDTKSSIIGSMMNKGARVLAVKLKGFSSLLKGKLGPELAQYASSTTKVKGIFHSDELPSYGISEEETERIKKKLNLKEADAFALVAEEEEIAKNALKEVVNRCKISLKGIPKETRRVKENGETEFMRPLPGSGRMYPETDEPAIEITEQEIDKTKKKLPKLPDEMRKEFLTIGLSEELANQLLRSKAKEKFLDLKKKFPNVKPSVIATTLISTPKEVKKRFKVETTHLTEKNYEEILQLLNQRKVMKESILELMAEIAKNPEKSIERIVEEKQLGVLSKEEIAKVVKESIEENSEIIETLGKDKKDKAINFILGKVMAKLRGRCDAQEIRMMIEKEVLKN
jgi:glutamyl-tRNA(Gln) amidotransferase subunit E